MQAAFLSANQGAVNDYPPGPSASSGAPAAPAPPSVDMSNAALYFGMC